MSNVKKVTKGVKSLYKIAKNEVQGVDQYVSSEVADNRKNICLGCERLNHTLMQCKECFCFVNFKTTIKHEECPLGYWGKE